EQPGERQLALEALQRAAVGLDGVDLAVVREHAEGLRQRPVGQGIGRVPAVEDDEVRLQLRIVEVYVVAAELRAGGQRLVDDHARLQRGGVEGGELPLDLGLDAKVGAWEVGGGKHSLTDQELP